VVGEIRWQVEAARAGRGNDTPTLPKKIHMSPAQGSSTTPTRLHPPLGSKYPSRAHGGQEVRRATAPPLAASVAKGCKEGIRAAALPRPPAIEVGGSESWASPNASPRRRGGRCKELATLKSVPFGKNGATARLTLPGCRRRSRFFHEGWFFAPSVRASKLYFSGGHDLSRVGCNPTSPVGLPRSSFS
jgi:hypothetical protein